MKKLFPAAIIAAVAILIIFRLDAMQAAQNGLILWKDYVLPALLPYFILVSIFINSGTLSMSPITLFFLSVLSGAPGGARLCSYIDSLDSSTATDLTAILNTVSPMFIYSSFCAQMLSLPILALPLLAAQTLTAAIALSLYYKFKRPNISLSPPVSKSGFSNISTAISSSMNSLLGILGAMIFFSVIMAIAKASGGLDIIAFPFEWLLDAIGIDSSAIKPIIWGMLEITTGVAELAKSGLSIAQTAFCGGFIFSFGGLCIIAQSALFLDIKIKRYINTKLALALVSGTIAYLFSLFIPKPHVSVFAHGVDPVIIDNAYTFIIILISSALCQACVLLVSFGYRKMRRTNGATHFGKQIS